MWRVLCVLCACSFGLVICEKEYTGVLTPECVEAYHRIYVTRKVPPRTYQYHHEVLAEQLRSASRGDAGDSVDVGFRIIGGHKVPIREVPYQVLYGLYCGGTLIAPEWVITAAHCKEKDTFVMAGSSQRSEATRYPICAHFTHPLWNASGLHSHDYDYQLLLLREPVPVTAASRPIAIADEGDVQPGAVVGVSGWGHIKYKINRMEDFLRRVYVPIMSTEQCTSLPLNNYKTITPRMFCAGLLNGTKDSCQGDSGGPAVWRGRLVGLVSFGVGCAAAAQPGVYASMPHARAWIRRVTGLPL